MYRSHIGIGTNLGNKLENLQNSLDLLTRYSTVSNVSSIYETEAFGFESDSNFYNIVIEIKTSLSPQELLEKNQAVEKKMGRQYYNDGKYHSRVIDLDILTHDESIVDTEKLKIPHPHIQERNFVLIPLLEIAPDLCLPNHPNTPLKKHLTEAMKKTIKKIDKSVLIPC